MLVQKIPNVRPISKNTHRQQSLNQKSQSISDHVMQDFACIPLWTCLIRGAVLFTLLPPALWTTKLDETIKRLTFPLCRLQQQQTKRNGEGPQQSTAAIATSIQKVVAKHCKEHPGHGEKQVEHPSVFGCMYRNYRSWLLMGHHLCILHTNAPSASC